MMIHISRDEAQTLLNAVQDAMTTARNELTECFEDEMYAYYCNVFVKSFDLEQKIIGWLKGDQKE